MEIIREMRPPFSVIGKEGSTEEGHGFIQRLWSEANGNYHEVKHLAKLDEAGNPLGFWGLMSDFSRNYLPWEDGFTKGLYLAGVEVGPEAKAPKGWVRWDVPGYEVLRVQITTDPGKAFSEILAYMAKEGHALAGAVFDWMSPSEPNSLYMQFPIRKLQTQNRPCSATTRPQA